jgi:serine/threonine-protein kinase
MRACWAQGERVSLPVAAGIVIGILEGLHAAHEATSKHGEPLGIVHRDVSPQNVLVGIDGLSRVLDFGVAKATERLQTTRDGQIKGKIAYMAPEQLRGNLVDRRTDVYAAGAVLWELLAGRRMFQAQNDVELFGKVLLEDVPPLSALVPSLSKDVDELVLHAVARDPEQRFKTAREMALELERVVPPCSPRELGRWVERYGVDALRFRSSKVAQLESGAATMRPRIMQQAAAGPCETTLAVDTSPVALEVPGEVRVASDEAVAPVPDAPPTKREGAGADSASVLTAGPSPARSSRVWRLVAAGATVTAAVLLAWLAVSERASRRVAATRDPAPAAASEGTPDSTPPAAASRAAEDPPAPSSSSAATALEAATPEPTSPRPEASRGSKTAAGSATASAVPAKGGRNPPPLTDFGGRL